MSTLVIAVTHVVKSIKSINLKEYTISDLPLQFDNRISRFRFVRLWIGGLFINFFVHVFFMQTTFEHNFNIFSPSLSHMFQLNHRFHDF